MELNDKTLIFDVDGTICPLKGQNQSYDDLVPNKQIVTKICALKKAGWRIVLHTSRNMKTYKGNLGLINANTLPSLVTWLIKWNIPYDEIYCGKPWPGENGYYIDDRAIRPREFLSYDFQEIEDIIIRDRIDKGDL